MGSTNLSRRSFIKNLSIGSAAIFCPGVFCQKEERKRPNILFALADDWSWPHAGFAGDTVVKTPTFDRLAQEGVVFENAFVTAPSCTPSRGSILTGQYHWRLEEGGNLWSSLPQKFDVYPDLLEQTGYYVGFTRKGWGPGRFEEGGRKRNPAGDRYSDFKDFMETRPENTPFCFWFGSKDPHRKYDLGSGVKSGMKLEDVTVPSCFPDSEEIRSDICDYYWEVQRFDREVGELLQMLDQKGELENTIIVMSGDNGMPFPHCKSNLYDFGTHVPLVIRWGEKVKGGRVVSDFVSLADLAPTFLEAAGLEPTQDMTGKSLIDILKSNKSGQIEPERDHVLTGKERHAWVRRNGLGYPQRAIRTKDHLYIRNFKPERWPAGDPDGGENNDPKGPYGDIDDSPTKQYMMKHKNEPGLTKLFELAFGKRPAEELYDLKKDPDQLNNVADKPEYATIKQKLGDQLLAELRTSNDPRVLHKGDKFDLFPYYGGGGHVPVKE